MVLIDSKQYSFSEIKLRGFNIRLHLTAISKTDIKF